MKFCCEVGSEEAGVDAGKAPHLAGSREVESLVFLKPTRLMLTQHNHVRPQGLHHHQTRPRTLLQPHHLPCHGRRDVDSIVDGASERCGWEDKEDGYEHIRVI